MDAFEGLADPVRRDLLRRLAAGPERAGDLAIGHGISRPAVSRHLRVLTGAGLVQADTRGRERWFRLQVGGTAPVRELLAELDPVATTGAQGRGPSEEQLMALDTEVRRTSRDRTRGAPETTSTESTQESA